MKKSTRTILWIIGNGALAILLWYGIVEDIQGARYLGLFLAWFAIVGGLLLIFPGLSDELVRKHGGMSVPWPVSVPFDVAVISFLAWHGYIVTASFYAVHMFIQYGAIEKSKERLRDEST